MKKLLSLLLIMIMIFGLATCGEADLSTIDYESESESEAVLENDPIYAEIEDMLAPIEKFVEYNHILGGSIDYNDVSSEDFWNIVAIVVTSYEKTDNYGTIDSAGVYHLKWDVMLDFAKTFLYKTWYKHNTPSYKNSYSASADPGSGVIDLIPLSVDNYDASLESISQASHASYDYVLRIKLVGKEDPTKVFYYNVFLADWKTYLNDFYDTNDTAEHVMPYIVIGYQLEE